MKRILYISIAVLSTVGLVVAYLSLDLIVNRSGWVYINEEQRSIEYLSSVLEDSAYVDRKLTVDVITWLKSMESVRPGRYHIEEDEALPTVMNRFRSGIQEPLDVIIPSIGDFRQLAKRLGEQLMYDSASFYNFFQSDSALAMAGTDRANFSSLILPNTYELYWTIDPAGFLKRMQREREAFWKERENSLKRIGLSREEAITLASIVEKETNKVDEMPRVAGLYLNRLRSGWKLQSDPTALFGLRQVYPDTVVYRVLNAHIAFSSPYNTYENAGLPPGPISIPSTQAIDAVLQAEKHAYFYMVASAERLGYHEFSGRYDYDRHRALARKYQRYLDDLQ